MRKYFEPIADASLYEEFPIRQTGLDEILEVGKTANGTKSVRAILKFDIPTVLAAIPSNIALEDVEFDLVLSTALASKLDREQTILVHSILEDWAEGAEYFYQTAIQVDSGVTWTYRDTGSLWTTSGSTYDTGSAVSASSEWPIRDYSVNVSDIIKIPLSASVDTFGLLVKFDDIDESDNTVNGNIKFFSRNSHTIHVPYLIAKWDDASYTGSLSLVDMTQPMITPKNLQSMYKKDENVQIELTVRNKYPQKTFATMFSAFTGTLRPPETTYFSVVDITANKVIIPFDDYSKVSTTPSGSVINFTTQAMFPNRMYKLMFKLVDGDNEVIVDNNYRFGISK